MLRMRLVRISAVLAAGLMLATTIGAQAAPLHVLKPIGR